MTSKGPGNAPTLDGYDLRIGIIHGRWNTAVTDSLVAGAKRALTQSGVNPSNIITQSVPGSYELPLGAQRMITASQTTSSASLVTAASDLLSSTSLGGSTSTKDSDTTKVGSGGERTAGGPLDAVIAIGVLVKGSTMHFEYIADAVSHGLMRVQLDTGTPVIFGVLTCLNEGQAMTRAGLRKPSERVPTGTSANTYNQEGEPGVGADLSVIGGMSYAEQGHNHGEDWGKAAVEMAAKRKAWGEGRFVE